MKILFDNKWFIGAVNFYDHRKGFGYLVTNRLSYYVDASSFVEPSAKAEHGIVTFQVAWQEDGKKRAVNVRNLAKKEEDYRLVLDCFPSKGWIVFKNGEWIDLVSRLRTFVPRPLFLERLVELIENNAKRAPQTTLGLFQSFIDLFPKKGDKKSTRSLWISDYVSDYVFDRDYKTDDKEAWIRLFSIFTPQECLVIFNKYPTTCKYISDEKILKEFVEISLVEDCSVEKLSEFYSILSCYPKSIQTFAKNRIEEIADKRIVASLNDCLLDTRTDEKLIDEKISQILKLTSKTYDKEKAECLVQVKLRKFDEKKTKFEQTPWDYNVRENLFRAFEELGNEKDKYLTTVAEVLEKAILSCAEKGEMKAVNELILKLKGEISSDKGNLAVQAIKSIVKDYLLGQAETIDQKDNKEQSRYFDEYLMLSSLYGNEDKEELKREVAAVFQNATTIRPFLFSMEKGCGIFTADEAFAYVSERVKRWGAEEIRNFTYNQLVIKEDQRFSETILDKVFQWIGPRKIKDYYWGDDSNACQSEYYSQNCSFLEDVKELCEEAKLIDKWDAFLLTRDGEELIELYKNDLLGRLTDKHLKIVVDSIGLSSVQSLSPQWYNAPKLVNQEVVLGICKNSGCSVFPLFAERLTSLDLAKKDNLYLAVLLTELFAMDKPDKYKGDYSEIRNWETTFKNQLRELKNSNPNNKELSTILWAIHFQTTTSLETLTEIFAFLPPYVQIRCVKKLFQLICQGKICHTAESLYNLLNKGAVKMCLPLEIVFSYLKMREKKPEATLTNEVMLELLDGRDDHREWVEIRNMVTDCFGCWSVEEKNENDSWRSYYYSDYYNGKMKSEKQGVTIYVPRNMIDERGEGTKYNNKFFQSIQELLRITFNEDDYKVTENSEKGIVYLFEKKSEVELFGLARRFNFDCGRKNICFNLNKKDDHMFCECRLSDKLDNVYNVAFNWCENKPCFCPPLRFHVVSEWEQYTVLDFMRILHIPTDYINKSGKVTKYGYYIILSSYLNSFARFYDHLKCRECNQLMRPDGVSNFAFRAVTQFSCVDENCVGCGRTVYLNHCFNTKCNATIDSRDSKKCPNGQYICPECGACCSTENFRIRLNNLIMTGGEVSNWLMDFVKNGKGHWEKDEYYCPKCGGRAEVNNGVMHCEACQFEKTIPVYKSIRSTLEN